MVYASGVLPMLAVALKSLGRHDAGCPYQLRIVADRDDPSAYNEAHILTGDDVWVYDVGKAKTGSGQHARLLDRAFQDVESEYFLTMDSDCFPVADGWLKALVDMQTENVAASGILWPWSPPPDTIDRDTIEWKIRRQHCWNNTQTACQLMRTSLMCEKGWKFADPDGDDTNFGLMDKAHADGMSVVGFMPTRCPLSDSSDFYPEFNRHESVIFGDMVYHHVGATRECRGETKGKEEVFQSSRNRVYNEAGAEWMLAPGNSHAFKMDKEEDVAQFKMKMFYRSAVWFLENNTFLFGGGWV